MKCRKALEDGKAKRATDIVGQITEAKELDFWKIDLNCMITLEERINCTNRRPVSRRIATESMINA
jgi:hypothetical protein